MQRLLNIRTLLTIVMVSLVLVLPAIASNEPPDKRSILRLLKEQKFGEIEKVLTKYQMDYEERKESDETLRRAFQAFTNSAPSIQDLLNKWVKTNPNSALAYVARGTYYQHVGLLARGYNYASQTHQEQLREMAKWFAFASPDFQKALSLNPKLTIAYRELMAIAMTTGDRAGLVRYRDQGLTIDPASFIIREKYMFALQPKWGGSIEAMEEFLKQTRSYYTQNPTLKQLEGIPAYGRAEMLYKRNPSRAMEFHTQAIGQGNHWWVIYERGVRYHWLGQYPHAITDLTRALELYPQQPDVLLKRGWTHYAMKQFKKADADFNEAYEYDPLDPDILKARGHILWVKRKFPEALEAYTQALIYGEHKASVWRNIGNIQYLIFHNYPAALEAFQQALTLAPSDTQTQQAYQKLQKIINRTWHDEITEIYTRIENKILDLLYSWTIPAAHNSAAVIR